MIVGIKRVDGLDASLCASEAMSNPKEDLTAFGERLRNFLGGEEFEEDIERYLNQHAKTVASASNVVDTSKYNIVMTGEFGLEVHEIWQNYLKLIEDSMDRFRREEGLSEVEFKEAVENLPRQAGMIVRLMIASWEFTSFIELCVDHAEYMDEAKDDGGEDDDDDYKEFNRDMKEIEQADSKYRDIEEADSKSFKSLGDSDGKNYEDK